MHIFIETLYFSINLLLMFILFIWPSTSEFGLKNFFLIFLFLLIAGVCFFWERLLKKNQTITRLSQLNLPSLLKDYLATVRVDFSGWFPLALFAFITKPFLFDLCVIPSESMEPTFWTGDHVLLNRCAFGLRCPVKNSWRLGGRNPQRGEIVCFFPPTGTKNVYVKRVIGIGGDKVKVVGNAVMVIPKGEDEKNAKHYLLKTSVAQRSVDRIKTVSPEITPLKEENDGKSYFIQNIPSINHSVKEKIWEVPENTYFVMGDNRSNSEDSRYFDVVPRQNIIASPLIIVWNWRWMNNQTFPTVEWTRFFKFIR